MSALPSRRLLALLVLLAAATTTLAADAWKACPKEGTPGLPGNEVQSLTALADGSVWIGTLTGAALLKDGTFTPLKNDKGAPLDLSVWSVLDTPDGLLVGTGKGVLTVRGGKPAGTALAGFTVSPIVATAPGDYWALAKDRNDVGTLFHFQNATWQPVEALAKRRLTNLYTTANHHLWLTIDGNGVLEVDPAAGFAKAVHHLEGLNVTTLMQDSKGTVWCGLWANGLALWDGSKWTRELPKAKDSAILAIVEDNKQTYWVATSANGLWHRNISRTDWTCELADAGAINLLVATRDGRVWLSGQTLGGLRCWTGAEWAVSLASPLPIRALVETPSGALVAGGVLDGVYLLPK